MIFPSVYSLLRHQWKQVSETCFVYMPYRQVGGHVYEITEYITNNKYILGTISDQRQQHWHVFTMVINDFQTMSVSKTLLNIASRIALNCMLQMLRDLRLCNIHGTSQKICSVIYLDEVAHGFVYGHLIDRWHRRKHAWRARLDATNQSTPQFPINLVF